MTLVVAGNYIQYRSWCDSNGANPHGREVVYATLNSLRGRRRDYGVVFTGTYQERKDWPLILREIQQQRSTSPPAPQVKDEPRSRMSWILWGLWALFFAVLEAFALHNRDDKVAPLTSHLRHIARGPAGWALAGGAGWLLWHIWIQPLM